MYRFPLERRPRRECLDSEKPQWRMARMPRFGKTAIADGVSSNPQMLLKHFGLGAQVV
jgi:hypothetical protein